MLQDKHLGKITDIYNAIAITLRGMENLALQNKHLNKIAAIEMNCK